MNRYSLNARTLGSGVSVPETYWASTLNVALVYTLDNFVVLTGVFVQSSILLRASANVGFIRSAYFAAENVMQMVPTTTAYIKQFMRATQSNVVSPITAFSVGLLQRIASSVYTGITVATAFLRTTFFTGNQSVEEVTDVDAGTLSLITATTNNIRVTSTVIFTAFGQYASGNRALIVSPEDTNIEVSDESRDLGVS